MSINGTFQPKWAACWSVAARASLSETVNSLLAARSRSLDMLVDECGRFPDRDFRFGDRHLLENMPHPLVDIQLRLLPRCLQHLVQPDAGNEENTLRTLGDKPLSKSAYRAGLTKDCWHFLPEWNMAAVKINIGRITLIPCQKASGMLGK
jgi:hypothetical protein